MHGSEYVSLAAAVDYINDARSELAEHEARRGDLDGPLDLVDAVLMLAQYVLTEVQRPDLGGSTFIRF